MNPLKRSIVTLSLLAVFNLPAVALAAIVAEDAAKPASAPAASSADAAEPRGA